MTFILNALCSFPVSYSLLRLSSQVSPHPFPPFLTAHYTGVGWIFTISSWGYTSCSKSMSNKRWTDNLLKLQFTNALYFCTEVVSYCFVTVHSGTALQHNLINQPLVGLFERDGTDKEKCTPGYWDQQTQLSKRLVEQK